MDISDVMIDWYREMLGNPNLTDIGRERLLRKIRIEQMMKARNPYIHVPKQCIGKYPWLHQLFEMNGMTVPSNI